MTEYTLVFRRAIVARAGRRRAVWTVARPFTRDTSLRTALDGAGRQVSDISQVFVAPICSTLALDPHAYEEFLMQSGALNRALRALNGLTFAQPQTAENARKQIQSIVMAAEVNYIVRELSA